MTAVGDTSPLILLAKIGQLQLLHRIYDDILVPPAVHAEIHGGRAGHRDVATIDAAGWISIRLLEERSGLPSVGPNLGAGEREVIALALEIGGGTTVILDDLPGRRAAASLGVSVIGSAGVLLTAKRLGFLGEIRPALDDLRAAGLYLSEQQYRRVLSLAGE